MARRKRTKEALRGVHAELECKVRQRTAELQASNEQLQDSRAKFRDLAETVGDWVWEVDREGVYTYASPRVRDLLGYEPEEVLGKTPFDLMPPAEASRVGPLVRSLADSHLPIVALENVNVAKDGRLVVLETSGTPIVHTDGTFCGYRGVDRDITARKEAEAALKQSEAKYRVLSEEFRALLDAIPDMVFFKDTEGRHRFVNRAFERIMDVSQDEVVGKKDEDLLPPGLAEFCRRSDGAVYETRDVVREEEEMRGPDGAAFSLETIKAPIFGELGEITGLVGLARDITQRKRNEAQLLAYRERLEGMVEERTAALRESEERFRSLVESSLVGFFIVQEDRVVFLNPAQESIFGPVRIPLPLGEFEESVHAEDVEKFRDCREAVRAGLAGGREAEIRLRPKGCKPGERTFRRLHCRMAPVTYRGNGAILVNMVDVTQLREMERIAFAQEKMAALGQVAAGVAHEVRNPLSGLNLSLGTMENALAKSEGLEPETREAMQTMLKMARSASAKIDGVVKRVMDLANPAPPKMVPVSVNTGIRETLHLAGVTLRKAGVRLTTVLRTGLPTVLGDYGLFEQVLLNLLTNAAQAMEGRQEKQIEIASDVRDGHVVVSVADSGPGVPDEIREKIFDPFFTMKEEGTGIGLAFSHRVISHHGGILTVGTSRFGGALFTIRLPAGNQEDSTAI